mmetsp:Transcript_13273/g.22849  ORF Transcript_13273/g.22849 Transcript_13273/m.22849 type:complete len:123 (-) Transcript_13273:223-591(-)
MANPDEVAASFVQVYYQQFGADRSQLGSLYGENSMLTFEDKKVMGAQSIVELLVALPFQQVKHVAKSVDAQPTVGDGIIVFVNGDIFIDGSENGVKFSQIFNLQPNGDSFFVLNDIMKLNYC